MKKIIIALFLCMMMTGCNQKDIKTTSELNEIEGVSMTIKKDTLTRKSATIVIHDTSKMEYTYGSSYHIDKYDNGKWSSLKTIDGKNYQELVWNLIGYHVDEHGYLEIDIDWQNLYGILENGKYRLVKDVDNKEFSVEFELK